MSAEQFDDSMLLHLTEDIDDALLQWMQTYEIHPLNLTAIVLARLTWMAKLTDTKADFLKLLESPKDIIELEGKLPPKGELH